MQGDGGAMKFALHIPFIEQLGMELHELGEGTSELRLQVRPDHLNSWQVAHGGVLMTLLDVAMATAARSIHKDQADMGPGVVTVEMKTAFMRPAQGRLAARGKLLHRSTTMAFCEASVLDLNQQLCAHATGTFKYLRKLPTGERSLHSLQTQED
jgi:uncharacterized protein (TIGR00369 family)